MGYSPNKNVKYVAVVWEPDSDWSENYYSQQCWSEKYYRQLDWDGKNKPEQNKTTPTW